MKLTKTMREAFVRAAMQDVPSIDYQEKARELVQKAALELAPPAIQKLAKPGSAESQWLKCKSISLPGSLYNVMIRTCEDYPNYSMFPAHITAELKTMEGLNAAQTEQRRDLERKLSAAANSVTTRKALAELLPEFEKYLPADAPAACRSLPAIANVVAEFSKAGWPKSAKGGAK